MQNLGHTRSTICRSHLLQSPDTFVRAPLPGMERATAIVHAAPAMGSGFTQYSAELEAGGCLGETAVQRFIYVLSGAVVVELGGMRHALVAGGFAYLPQDCQHVVSATGAARLAVIEKPYQPIDGVAAAAALISTEEEIAPQALMGDEALQVRSLLPDHLGFDFAVNTMTYQPGAALAMVEVHVMEHGLLMLEGGGIYRLADSWYPVAAGDFIWMAPFCPQWFGALGKAPAKYLIYKNWNRSPAVR
ncbi:MAG TPA: (S)-ureidoglycine aminohydrolase [Acidisarcina sp.]